MALTRGTRLGAYEITAAIGAGGMGEVYQATDTKLGRDVALKILPASFTNDPERVARFRREAQVLASLNHPHIVTIFSIEDADEIQFITMELVEGRSLDQMICHGGVTWREFFTVGIALADALTAAHLKHIVHRDLKPSNVMVMADGRVKVLDFGLARIVDADTSSQEVTRLGLTRADTIVGTIPYMSPEQVEIRPLDPRTDLFSLGIMLYELATGERPFHGASSAALISSILKDVPAPVDARRPDVPAHLGRLITRCLEKDPRDRIQTATEIVIDLKAARLAWESASQGTVTHDAGPSTTHRIASIAVLPFVDLSPTKDQDWFCDGIAEEILNALTPLEGLKVAARASAFSFKGRNVDLQTIGKTLHVETVLDGSLRRSGERIRVTARLSNVANGFQLWSERYDRKLQDIFDIQDDIARAIAERLKLTLAGDRLVEPVTRNFDAYQLYLKGRTLLDRRGLNVPAALELFEQAVQLDPDYALAWTGIADALTVLAYAGSVRGSESKRQALTAARRSIELDPESASAHTALACATLLFENDRRTAKQEFEHALKLAPTYVLGRCWYSLLYLQWACGDFTRGIAEGRRAFDSDPLSAYAAMSLGCCLFTAGRVDEAIATCRTAVRLDPESFVARWALGISLGLAEQFPEAVSTFESAATMSGRHSLALSQLAVVFARWGKRSEARALHQELMARAALGYVPSAHLVLTAEAAGHEEEALTLARSAWNEREPSFILHARHHPAYGTLRSKPQFAAILREMDAV